MGRKGRREGGGGRGGRRKKERRDRKRSRKRRRKKNRKKRKEPEKFFSDSPECLFILELGHLPSIALRHQIPGSGIF